MRLFASIILLIAFSAQSFSTWIIEANYYINRNYIAQNLCENKDKPNLHCCGKCFLKKQLKNQERQEQSPYAGKDKTEILLFTPAKSFVFNSYQVRLKREYHPYHNSILVSFPHSVFHPPTV